MYKLPKFFAQELESATKLSRGDFLLLKERGVDREYFEKLEKAWRTGKKVKEDKDV